MRDVPLRFAGDEEHEGVTKYNLEPGGIVRIAKPSIHVGRRRDDRCEIRVRVDAKDGPRVKRILEGKLKGHNKSLADLDLSTEVSTRSDSAIGGLMFSIAGEEIFRAAAKMALLLFAAHCGTDVARSGEFALVRNFIERGVGDMSEIVRLDFDPELPPIQGITPFQYPAHVIVVSANPALNNVAAFVGLYGGIGFSVMLAREWRHDGMTVAHFVNPLTGEWHDAVDFESWMMPVGRFAAIQAELATLKERVGTLLYHTDRRSRELRWMKIASEEIQELFRGRIGTRFTEEDARMLSGNIMRRIGYLEFKQPFEERTSLAEFLDDASDA